MVLTTQLTGCTSLRRYLDRLAIKHGPRLLATVLLIFNQEQSQSAHAFLV
jgi:hypothetical protein